MKKKMFLLALTACAGTAFAQNSIVSSIPGTFVDISVHPSATALVGGDTDDGAFPFTSSVTNAVFSSTEVSVCSNGFVQFGPGGASSAYFNGMIEEGTASPVEPNDVQTLFVYWDDQFIRSGEGGNIYWVEGPGSSFGLPASVGNVLIIQWNSVDHYFDSPEPGTYQLQVFQNPLGGAVVAQMLYQDVNFGNTTDYDDGVSATIGFAAGSTGGPASLNNVQYSFDTAGSVTSGTVLSLQLPTAPVPPSATGAASPPSAAPGDTVVYTANVRSGFNPVSTGITVRGNLTAVGGSATALFHDDGLNGDAAAGDNVFSYSYVIPGGQSGGAYSIALTVTDAQARTGGGIINATVFNPTNLGTLVDGVNVSSQVDLALGEIKWYKAMIGDCSESAGRSLRVTTANSTAGGDSEIGVYDASGELVDSNDDAFGLLSDLTYGFRGDYGDIGPGQIFIAVGSFNTNFSSPFGAVSTGPANSFTLDVLQTNTFPPLASGRADALGGGHYLLTVAVEPGVNPASTGIAVHADLSSLGGSSNQAFRDDGLGGDAAAGDNIFSFTATAPAADPDGTNYSVSYSLTDNQGDNLAGTIEFVSDVAGDLPATAVIPVGTGALSSLEGYLTYDDVDFFKISICDVAGFSASTIGSQLFDTQLFLFDAAGMGVTTNDEDPAGNSSQSTITGQFVPSAGTYYIAISAYDRDPASGGAEIWADAPWDTERQPDGPGSAGAVDGWEGFAFYGNASYTITLTGACYPGNGPVCGAADVAGTGGVPGADGHLDNNDFVVFIDYFFNHNALADQGSIGGQPGADGVWDNNDFVVFIDNFFNAPASCR